MRMLLVQEPHFKDKCTKANHTPTLCNFTPRKKKKLHSQKKGVHVCSAKYMYKKIRSGFIHTNN